MSHTFTGPQGTTFIYNSDLSGMVMAFGVANFSGDAEIPGADLVAFHEHVADREHSAGDGIAVKTGALEVSGADRERIEFVRRAAIAILTTDERATNEAAWAGARALWEAKPDGM